MNRYAAPSDCTWPPVRSPSPIAASLCGSLLPKEARVRKPSGGNKGGTKTVVLAAWVALASQMFPGHTAWAASVTVNDDVPLRLVQGTRTAPSCRGVIFGGNSYLDSRNNGPVRAYLDVDDSALNRPFTPDSTFNRVLVLMRSPVIAALSSGTRLAVGFRRDQSGPPRLFPLEQDSSAPSGYRIASGLDPEAEVNRQRWRVRTIEISLHAEGQSNPICRTSLRISGEG